MAVKHILLINGNPDPSPEKLTSVPSLAASTSISREETPRVRPSNCSRRISAITSPDSGLSVMYFHCAGDDSSTTPLPSAINAGASCASQRRSSPAMPLLTTATPITRQSCCSSRIGWAKK